MIVNSAAIAAMFKSFNVLFNEAFTAAKPTYTRVAMEVPSTTKSQDYGWLGQFPGLKKWVGERVVKNLVAHGYTIVNDPFEATISIPRSDIEDDQFGVYNPVVQEMGRSSATWPDELTYALLKRGFVDLCYDGQPMFDTDHPVNDVSVSNMQAGSETPWFLLDVSRAIKPIIFQSRKKPQFVSKTAPTDDAVFNRNEYVFGVDARGNTGFGLWQLAFGSKALLNADNYAAARAAMGSFKGDEDRPLNVMPNLLVVPPMLEGAAREILTAETINGTTNKWRNTAELLVSPYLA